MLKQVFHGKYLLFLGYPVRDQRCVAHDSNVSQWKLEIQLRVAVDGG